jgi:uncharacterized iron-regulated protein
MGIEFSLASKSGRDWTARWLTPCLMGLALASCGSMASTRDTARAVDEDAPPWAAPPLSDAVTVRDGRTGEQLSFEELLDVLAKADAVFLGETHIDETTHRVELATYEGLLARRGGKVVLAMEMFERDVQDTLDRYLAGEIDEATFRKGARPWSNYTTAYRPLIERAKAAGAPVVASNFPLPLRRRIAMEGPGVIETLEGAARRQAPVEMHPNTAAYWRRVDNAVRSHRSMMGDLSGDEQRLWSTQSLWDNSMGEACADALDAHPGSSVLHVNGGFHSAYWDGTARQFMIRKPNAKALTVAISPRGNPSVAGVGDVPYADYVVFAEARASDLNEGTYGVNLQRELKYRLHLAPHATDDDPAPLLIWLGDDGLTAKEGLELWKERLGGEVSIAVVEPPYRGTQRDLSSGGVWYWADTFTEDLGTMVSGVDRIWGYLLRNLPVDPARVCVAGEGTGATVVGATALLSGRIDGEFLAFAPRRYSKIKDFSLPLPEFRGDAEPADVTLRVFAKDGDQQWWSGELAEYTGVGLKNELLTATVDPWRIDVQADSRLRAALGLEPRPAVMKSERKHLVVGVDSPRARHWGRLRALAAGADGAEVAVLAPADDATGSEEIPLGIDAASFALPGALPLCPGPFGGTTVLVVPAGLDEAATAAWTALEDDDPIQKRHRFHRLRVAVTGTERDLPAVLSKLQSESRFNVLVVPAVFCADAATMHDLERSVRELQDRMTLHWLPGLGGS